MNKINEENNYPKVLVISHNSLSNQSNGKTISSLFSNWKRESIAQIYFKDGESLDFSVTETFFQLTDFDILKRIYTKSADGRRVKFKKTSKKTNVQNKKPSYKILSLLRRKKWPISMIFRDIVWRISNYRTPQVCEFIDTFKPDIIFFQGSNNTFSFNFTKWICNTRNIPLILQITDDYISTRKTWDLFFWIHLFKIRRCYKWAMKYASTTILIGEKMADEYSQYIEGSSLVAMNSVDISQPIKQKNCRHPVRFSLLYAGNLGLNRWIILEKIIQSLKEIELENKIKSSLSIYSLSETNDMQLKALHQPPYGYFKGKITSDKLYDLRMTSDILVHVEAFDSLNKHVTRLSISTKIPEYMASGRCIFAVGPKDVASIEYLEKEQAGCTVSSSDIPEIKTALLNILKDPALRQQYIKNALNLSKRKHNRNIMSKSVHKAIISSCYKHEEINYGDKNVW